MPIVDLNFEIVDSNELLHAFATTYAKASWLSLDTEFIGEKRFHTLLCLVQVATPDKRIHLIDTLKVTDISPLLELIQDPEIVKLVHAGENDFRLFYQNYKILPQNIFDTQIAAGFLGHHYPISYQKLLDKELDVQLGGDYSVSNWDHRPLSPKQIMYAINDVIYLPDLYAKLSDQLAKLDRLSWAMEEFKEAEKAKAYESDSKKEALGHRLIADVGHRERVFLLRLFQWRYDRASERDVAKNMILPDRLITVLVKNIRGGKKKLSNHRQMPYKVIKDFWEDFSEMYNRPGSEEELALVKNIPKSKEKNEEESLKIELLHWLVKAKCMDAKVASGLLLRGSSLKKMKKIDEFFGTRLETGWRQRLLGTQLLFYLKNLNALEYEWSEGQLIIKLGDD